jgi:GNAT superfamily N-acetyltransferase
MDTSLLIRRYQAQLVDALAARIAATEAAIGPVFGFEIRRRDLTTLVIAHSWPDAPQQVPFHRLYNYPAAEAEDTDTLLAYGLAAQIDMVVEVGPEPQQHAEALLHQHHFAPHWAISWLQLELAHVPAQPYAQPGIRRLTPDALDTLAALFVQGYGYEGPQAAAWQTFARYGYAAPGFDCFVAEVDQTPAAFGVLHIQGTTALIDGAATVPDFRGRGIHKALLAARIEYARAQGCTHAFSRTGAGSLSQHNMQKLGFREVYRTSAWRRSSPR